MPDENPTTADWPDGWPIVAPDDDGIRPAGPSDACLYCHSRVGMPHGRGCVVVSKRVRILYHVTVDVDVPHHWQRENIEFQRNEGYWCASNMIDELQRLDAERGCLCDSVTCDYVEVVDSTPHRELRSQQPESSTVHPVSVKLRFDSDGIAVTRRQERDAEPVTERVELNAENQGTLAINLHTDSGDPDAVGYVLVIQKWAKEWPKPAVVRERVHVVSGPTVTGAFSCPGESCSWCAANIGTYEVRPFSEAPPITGAS